MLAEKETVSQQNVDEDKIFLSNQKLREGNEFRDVGDYERAAELFSEAIELNPENALVLYNRGLAYMGLKLYENALADIEKAIRLRLANKTIKARQQSEDATF